MSLDTVSVATVTPDTVTLGAINLEAVDPHALAGFWAEVVGSVPDVNGDFVYLPPAGPGGFGMFLRPLEGARPERQPMHLDLTVAWGARERTAARLVALGATHRWDVLEEFAHVRWTTLADPEGNLFCVAEHPPADVQGSGTRH